MQRVSGAEGCELLSDFVYSFFEHNFHASAVVDKGTSCELLSDFVYSFFEHNAIGYFKILHQVVNCFQILYIRSLNTISERYWW